MTATAVTGLKVQYLLWMMWRKCKILDWKPVTDFLGLSTLISDLIKSSLQNNKTRLCKSNLPHIYMGAEIQFVVSQV